MVAVHKVAGSIPARRTKGESVTNLDLVDPNDQVIGKISEDEAIKTNSKNIRFVNGFIENDHGQIWIPTRSSSKRMFPSCLDFSVGGHVEAGETYKDAFIREVKEELGLELSDNFKLLAKLNPQESGTNNFMAVYKIELNQEPDYNKNDFVSAKWFYPKEVLKEIESGKKAKTDLPIVIKNVYPQ